MLEINKNLHYCKWCNQDFILEIPLYSGPSTITCQNCGREHARQFELGVAVSCDIDWNRRIRRFGALAWKRKGAYSFSAGETSTIEE